MQEEKKAKEEKDAIIAAAKKRGAEKAKLTKSLIIMDVKPWDDTTGASLKPVIRNPFTPLEQTLVSPSKHHFFTSLLFNMLYTWAELHHCARTQHPDRSKWISGGGHMIFIPSNLCVISCMEAVDP